MGKRKQKIIGVQLPKTDGEKRSSTPFNKNTWIAAAKAIPTPESEQHQRKLESEKKWRFGYIKYVQEHMRLCANPDYCLKAGEAGWDYVYKNMEYYRVEDGTSQSLSECLENPNADAAFETGVLQGTGKKKTKLEIPIGKKKLSKGGAIDLVKKWENRGVIESDTSGVLKTMLNDNDWLKSLDNKVFVLLGALSEMGPLQPLLDYGATVVAVDYSAEPVQERLFKQLEGRAGKLIVPLKPGTLQLDQSKWAANSGADLLYDFPEVAEWLVGVEPEKEMIIGPYCYLDGERFIKIVAAMDGICTTVAKKRDTKTGYVYYATPTDCHMVTEEVVTAAKKQTHGGLAAFFSMLSAKPSFPADDVVNGVPFVNCVVPEQGPNYILAKRMQTWRAMLARQNGQTVSLNVAPTTKTVSVMKNKIFAFTMAGMPSFVPMEPFETQTTKAVMSALLINDFTNPKSSSNPAVKLDHPMHILQTTSVHGGMYRVGKAFSSIGMPAFFVAVVQKYGGLLVLLVLGLIFLARHLL